MPRFPKSVDTLEDVAKLLEANSEYKFYVQSGTATLDMFQVIAIMFHMSRCLIIKKLLVGQHFLCVENKETVDIVSSGNFVFYIPCYINELYGESKLQLRNWMRY